ncbi:hypothetical protein GGD66_005916 [Bradyrhizobium sp. CIR48]|uniref:hypothetical protein n=1 Tax=Bradyrhizobium sp. CIR48 TaxID=2663840 RepID=UPI001605680B|nr:hypothetical protein [Bradyrhizobium sp. CIR48]MBB4427334.1 hypothetical protein [Bradyrhizobium sp. CIR48]
MPLAFDFKSEGAGAAAQIQGALLFLYIFLSGLFWLATAPSIQEVQSPLLGIVVGWFCFESSLTALVNGQELYPVFINTIPVLIFGSSAYVTARALNVVKDLGTILTALKILALIYLLSRFLIILLGTGIDLMTIRYQILGGSVNACLGLIATSLLFRLTILDLIIVSATLIVVGLSVTRTQVVVALAQFAIYARAPWVLMVRGKLISRTILLGCLLGTALTLDLVSEAGIVERWFSRLFVSSEVGFDPTLLTRRAEVNFMAESFLGSPGTFLFGQGLAAPTILTGPEAAMAAQLVGRLSVEQIHSIGFGHQNYWAILFIGGVVGGGPLLCVLFWHGFQALSFVSWFRQHRWKDEGVFHLGVWGATIVIGMLTYGFLAGLFGDRIISLWYGIGTGLLMGCRSRIGSTRRLRIHASKT